MMISIQLLLLLPLPLLRLLLACLFPLHHQLSRSNERDGRTKETGQLQRQERKPRSLPAQEQLKKKKCKKRNRAKKKTKQAKKLKKLNQSWRRLKKESKIRCAWIQPLLMMMMRQLPLQIELSPRPPPLIPSENGKKLPILQSLIQRKQTHLSLLQRNQQRVREQMCVEPIPAL